MRSSANARRFDQSPQAPRRSRYGLSANPRERRWLKVPFLGYQSPLGLVNAITIGALLMSPLGWEKLLLIGENYVPEIFIVALCIFNAVLNPRFLPSVAGFLSDIRSATWIAACSILAILGVAYHGDVLAAYADLRTCLAVGLSYVYAVRASEKELQNEVFVALTVSLLAALLYYWIAPYDYSTPKRIFPTTALLAVSYIGAVKKGGVAFYGATAIGLALVAISNYRSNYIIGVIVIVITVFYGLVGAAGEKKWVTARRRLAFLAIGGVTVALFEPISALVLAYLSSDPDRYYQSVYKTTEMLELLETGNYADEEIGGGRLGATRFVFDHIYELLLPSGLGDRAWEMNWHSAWMAPNESILLNSVDGIHFFMFLHFGGFLSALLVFYVFWKWLRAALLSPRREMVARGLLWIGLAVFGGAFGGHVFMDFGFAVPSGLLFGIFARVSAREPRSSPPLEPTYFHVQKAGALAPPALPGTK